MMPKRIQRSRKKGARIPKNTVCISRPSKWGNPFNWKHSPSDEISERYAKLHARFEYDKWLNGLDHENEFQEQRQWILDHVHELKDKNLACWCRLCEKHRNGKPLDEFCSECDPCHADVLGRLAKNS